MAVACRVDERGLVKVADFGLSRELIVQDYYRLCHSKTPVPVRWMAPESLSANVFTTMSDVVRSCLIVSVVDLAIYGAAKTVIYSPDS